MSPIEIEVLLHCYYSAESWTKNHIESPASNEAHKFLYGMKLIDNCEYGFKTTKRGNFMVKEGLCKVNLPVIKKVFTFPENK